MSARRIGTDGKAALHLPLPPLGRDVQPHTLGSAASGQIHPVDPLCSFPMNFSIWRFPSCSAVSAVIGSELRMLLVYSHDQADC